MDRGFPLVLASQRRSEGCFVTKNIGIGGAISACPVGTEYLCAGCTESRLDGDFGLERSKDCSKRRRAQLDESGCMLLPDKLHSGGFDGQPSRT
jgi:hypothetical protein